MRKRLRTRLENHTARFLMQLPRGLLSRVVESAEYRGVTLDPSIALLVRLAELSKKPPLESMTPERARRSFHKWLAPFDVARIEVDHVEDRRLRGVPVRVYRSRGLANELPATIFFHGGGFVIGTLDGYDNLCRHLSTRTGGAVVSVDYRLAPEHQFPAASEDAFAVLEAIAAGELAGIDRRRLAVAGDSAGGALAAITAHHARDRDLPLALQYLMYPVTDLAHDYASFRELVDRSVLLTRGLLEWFADHIKLAPEQRVHWRASPIRASSFAGLAPARVITAGFDPLRDEGEAYARKLRDAGVETTHACFESMPHGFLAFGGVNESARDLIEDWVRATNAAFKRAPSREASPVPPDSNRPA
jgi:acetyl esterase